MDCKNCVKEDVCDQKELLKRVKVMIDNIEVIKAEEANAIRVIPKRALKINFGIEINVECTRAVKKQIEFSPGWTNAIDKNI